MAFEREQNISKIDKKASLLNSISMYIDGLQFSLPAIFNYVSGPLTHAKKNLSFQQEQTGNLIKCMLFFLRCLTCIKFLYHIKKKLKDWHILYINGCNLISKAYCQSV